MYVQEMSNYLMQCVYVCADCFGECKRDWEVGLRYGVRMNHTITLESIESIFCHIFYM